MAAADKQREGEENVGVSYKLDHFAEAEEVKTIISSIGSIHHDPILLEAAAERFVVILDKYQEQPHLLDPHLDDLVQSLQTIVMDTSNPPKLVQQAFKYLYYITKVRGPKYVVRLFSHEVSDMEPVLGMLAQQDPTDHETWETRYMLLVWLSIVCMIPFELSRLDGQTDEHRALQDAIPRRRPVVERILDTAKMYLSVPDKSRDAAALLISKFVTRPDVKKQKLAEFLDWSLETLTKANGETMQGTLALTGVLTTLALLFKHGKRDDLVPYAPTVLQQLVACKMSSANNTLLRKLNVKLIQRLGLTFLKPRLAAWRYMRGNRSLADNLEKPFTQNDSGSMIAKVEVGSGQDEDEEYDVPEEIEEVIEKLLSGLKDKDTVVRWSAAKGVGRISGRLPKELADEVLSSTLELFSFGEGDAAWHGGCLAIAELGRRGLLLPQRLPEVVPVVLRALTYDEKKGFYSVGSHVRDAACYVCWSFARAYDPAEVKPYVKDIASALVVATLFDREVNCRKAASASFQENVGRQGTFPHGIDILTTCDYFAVGNRSNTYLNLSVYVAQFEEYTVALIDNLLDTRLQHWDSAVRELAAKSLHKLTERAPEYMTKTALPKMLSRAVCIDLYSRHGNILGCAEVVHALHIHAQQNARSVVDLIEASHLDALKSIVPKLTEAKLFRGLGGEFMRQAVCVLIEKLSISGLPWHGDPIIELWQSTIDDNLSHTEPPIQEAAVRALSVLCPQYYLRPGGATVEGIQDSILDYYIEQLGSTLQFSRVGFAQALGALPKEMFRGRLMKVLIGLISATEVSGEPGKFAEARRDAVKAVANIAVAVGVDGSGCDDHVITQSTLDRVLRALLSAMNDYTTDSRGDVGAWVREASMTGLEKLVVLVAGTDPSLFSPETCEKIFCCLAQQAAEKIDRTRAHAGDILFRLIHRESAIPHVPHHQQLLEIFPRGECADLNWSAPADCFPLVTRLLGLSTYRAPVLLGLTVSAGGLTESLVRHSSASLLSFLKEIQNSKEMVAFTDTLLDIYRNNRKNDRVIIPLFKMIDLLMSNGCFEMFVTDESCPFPLTLLELTKEEIRRIGDAKKIITSIPVFCNLLQFPGATRRKSFQQLLILLCHKYPRVRKATADQLYTTALTFDDIIPEETLEDVLAILSETMWESELGVVRPERNKLCDILDIPRPVLKAPIKPTDTSNKNKDEFASYQDLLSRHVADR